MLRRDTTLATANPLPTRLGTVMVLGVLWLGVLWLSAALAGSVGRSLPATPSNVFGVGGSTEDAGHVQRDDEAPLTQPAVFRHNHRRVRCGAMGLRLVRPRRARRCVLLRGNQPSIAHLSADPGRPAVAELPRFPRFSVRSFPDPR